MVPGYHRPAVVKINLGAIRRNLENEMKHLEPGQKMLAVVKANAYGHGAVEVARVADEVGAAGFCVAILDEALQLRRHDIVKPILVLGVVFVNGWTDAPNAIATCITTRCIRPRPAIIMSAVFNFLGVLIMTKINASVASTISNMVDFGNDTSTALLALSAALFSIVVYSTAASYFGIPTSESHSLIAGLTGAAIASGKGLAAVNGSEWIKVIYGLVLSLILGFAIGYAVCRLVVIICRRMNRQKTNRFFSYAQILGAACMSFMHGAQDGQKFIGVLFLGIAFSNGETSVAGAIIPVWLMILCSAVMGLGTSVGGEKIIRSVGMDMVKLEKYQGFSADMAASLCLLLSSVFGIPVSTTHTKTSAIMGVGASKRLSSINFSVVREMMLTWVFTFPGCGIISFLMTKLFLAIF